MKNVALILILIGTYLVIDGIISFMFYYSFANQLPLEHSIRIVRAFLGLLIVAIGISIKEQTKRH